MLCPKCQGTTRVKHSKGSATDVRRRRQCVFCKLTFQTSEQIVTQQPQAKPYKPRKRVLKPRPVKIVAEAKAPMSRQEFDSVWDELSDDSQISLKDLGL